MTFRVLAVGALVACSVTLSFGQTRPKQNRVQAFSNLPQIVQKALVSARLRYSGVRVVQFGVGAKSKSHEEIVLHDGDRTRIEFPSNSPLSGQVIVEDSKQRQQFFPRRNAIEVLPPRNDVTMVRLAIFVRRALKQGWQIGTAGGEQIAGIDTQMAYVQDPRGTLRQKMWIDPNTGMILGRAIYNNNGEAQGSFRFSQIDYRPQIRAQDFVLNQPGAKVITPAMKINQLATRNGFTPTMIRPESGYQLESVRMVRVSDDQALSQVYSSENGKISLFQLKQSVDPMLLKKIANGRFKVYTWQRNGETLALVGELDERKLQEIATQLQGA